MTINFNYPNILELFPEHLDPRRNESAAFLIWYLENYYRLDTVKAVDSVCDQRGDKGIDGIFVDDNTQTIVIFQSKISQKNTTVGDASLKELTGTLRHFQNRENVHRLIDSAGRAQVAKLVKRLEIIDKIEEYELRGEFLSNVNIDANGNSYLSQATEILFVGREELEANHISSERNAPIHTPVRFDVSSFQITKYTVDANIETLIVPVRARELIEIDGIANQSLFIHNVRGPLGKTNVNKAITKSIRDPRLHKKFPLFHNGITIIAGKVKATDEKLTISDYFVVNGCQSLTSLFANQKEVTDNLYVLAKFIKIEPTSSLAKQITEFSNNQNGVRPRDFKANSSQQIRLQNEFKRFYSGIYWYEIKRGEAQKSGASISNEDAGLYLMAFDLKEPWATHRKYQVFDDKHAALFGRPEVNADRIVLCQVLREEIDKISKDIENTLLGKYVLTRYLLMYIIRELLEVDTLGKKVIENATAFVRAKDKRNRFRKCIRTLLKDVLIDLNAELKQYSDDFDYRGNLRDEKWVASMSRTIVTDYQRQVSRERIPSFSQDWKSSAKSSASGKKKLRRARLSS